jgi:hypothetical protein
MASISSRAKHFIQPTGGFLGIVRFSQEDGIADYHIEEDFIRKYLKKQPFPKPYDTPEKSMRLVRKTILALVHLEKEIEPALLFEDALKGAANIGDSENAGRLFERINNSDRNFRGFIDDTYVPENDILDDGMIGTVCDLISYEYFVNPRYSGKHTAINISDELADYMFDAATCIMSTCIFSMRCAGDVGKPYASPVFRKPASLLPAYTKTVNSGSIDLLTYKTVWKIFFSNTKKQKPTTPETLEVLMQYIMLIRAKPELKKSIEYLGIYDPTRNLVYTLKVTDIPADIIETVSSEVIGY